MSAFGRAVFARPLGPKHRPGASVNSDVDENRERGLVLFTLEIERPESGQVPLPVTIAEVTPPDGGSIDGDVCREWPASPLTARASHENRVSIFEPDRNRRAEEVSGRPANLTPRESQIVASELGVTFCISKRPLNVARQVLKGATVDQD